MINYKEASIKDIPIIQDIARKTWPNTFKDVMSIEQINYMLDLIYNKTALIEQMNCFQNFILIKYNDEIVGFTSYELNYKGKPQLMIHKVYLLPLSQGLGIGKSIFNYLESIAITNELRSIMLKVFYKNNNAINFYLKKNFTDQGIEISDIGNGFKVKDCVMIKDLN